MGCPAHRGAATFMQCRASRRREAPGPAPPGTGGPAGVGGGGRRRCGAAATVPVPGAGLAVLRHVAGRVGLPVPLDGLRADERPGLGQGWLAGTARRRRYHGMLENWGKLEGKPL